MGHKGIRDGGPPRKPGFRPNGVVGLPIKQALIELAHEGYDAEIRTTREGDYPRADVRRTNRAWLTVRDGLVISVEIG
jgi:hypothetical protein